MFLKKFRNVIALFPSDLPQNESEPGPSRFFISLASFMIELYLIGDFTPNPSRNTTCHHHSNDSSFAGPFYSGNHIDAFTEIFGQKVLFKE